MRSALLPLPKVSHLVAIVCLPCHESSQPQSTHVHLVRAFSTQKVVWEAARGMLALSGVWGALMLLPAWCPWPPSSAWQHPGEVGIGPGALQKVFTSSAEVCRTSVSMSTVKQGADTSTLLWLAQLFSALNSGLYCRLK